MVKKDRHQCVLRGVESPVVRTLTYGQTIQKKMQNFIMQTIALPHGHEQLFVWRQENLPDGGAKKDNHPKWVLQYLQSQNNRQNSHVLLIILDVKIKD